MVRIKAHVSGYVWIRSQHTLVNLFLSRSLQVKASKIYGFGVALVVADVPPPVSCAVAVVVAEDVFAPLKDGWARYSNRVNKGGVPVGVKNSNMFDQVVLTRQ